MTTESDPQAADSLRIRIRPAPSAADFRQLHQALVSQLPDLSDNWWRRVREATKRRSDDELKLLRAEAEHRLQHEDRRRQKAVLEVIFRMLGFISGKRDS